MDIAAINRQLAKAHVNSRGCIEIVHRLQIAKAEPRLPCKYLERRATNFEACESSQKVRV